MTTIKTWQERAGTFKETYLGYGAMAHFGKEVQAEIDELRADAERYAAKRKEIFLKSMRMQCSGERQTEEEFNANYDANCDKAIKGFVADHRGVLVFNAAMLAAKAVS